jgi:hypothetical protein
MEITETTVRSSKNRSKVSNGRLLPMTDGRTATARRVASRLEEFHARAPPEPFTRLPMFVRRHDIEASGRRAGGSPCPLGLIAHDATGIGNDSLPILDCQHATIASCCTGLHAVCEARGIGIPCASYHIKDKVWMI